MQSGGMIRECNNRVMGIAAELEAGVASNDEIKELSDMNMSLQVARSKKHRPVVHVLGCDTGFCRNRFLGRRPKLGRCAASICVV